MTSYVGKGGQQIELGALMIVCGPSRLARRFV
jgi:hypothetical protein